MMEDLNVDDGRVVTSLWDCEIPTASDVPQFRAVIVPGGTGPSPFGAKMVGDAKMSGVAPAIVNAVSDAVGIYLSRYQ